METAIETRKLARRFGGKTAVADLTLRVPRGGLFVLAGPNGAGKSTTIKMLMNLLRPTSGDATVLGTDSGELGPETFRQIGYVSEDQRLPEWLTVRELLAMVAPLYPTWDAALCASLCKRFSLPPERRIRELSRGMRMKAALLSALAFRPRLLVLDEPFSGLDPLVRDELAQGILELAEEEGWAVFLSTHDLAEVERLADHLGILNEGVLRVCEPVERLQARFRQVRVALGTGAPPPGGLPASWLLPAQEGGVLSFVESAYDEQVGEAAIRRAMPGCAEVALSALSLRELFVVLAKTYRLEAEGGRR